METSQQKFMKYLRETGEHVESVEQKPAPAQRQEQQPQRSFKSPQQEKWEQQQAARQKAKADYEANRKARAQNWQRASTIVKPNRGRLHGERIARFFRGSQQRRTPQPQQGNSFFSNFRDFGKPHPLSMQMRIGAGSENDKKYIRNRFLW